MSYQPLPLSGYLSGLTPSERNALEAHLVSEVLQRGSAVFRQGEPPEWVFIVTRGALKVTRSGTCGRSVITELLFPGDICGGLCALQGCNMSVSGIALEETEILKIPVSRFQQLTEEHPGLLLRALECCRGKFLEQREMLVGMALERVEQRAARALLALLSSAASADSGQTRVALTRREFAELIGTTPETAVRILSEFRRRGLIRPARKGLFVSQVEDLRRLAQGIH